MQGRHYPQQFAPGPPVGAQQPAPPPQQQQQPFLPPHLRHTVQPQQQQQQQVQAQPSGLLGLLAAHRNKAANEQPPPQQHSLPPHLQPPPQQQLPPHLQLQHPQQQLTGGKPPPPGYEAHHQPPPVAVVVAAAANNNNGPKAPPPGFAHVPAAAAGGSAAVVGGGRAQLPAHLQQAAAAGGSSGAAGTPPQAAAAAAAEAPAGPSPAQQQAQQAQAAVVARPRPGLHQWLAQLRAEFDTPADQGSPPFCNTAEGLKWVQGFAPEAHAVLDGQFMKYFPYIRDTHGPHVLTCVLFFCLGHHNVCRGASANLQLFYADFPAKVLNQRASFYRLMFGTQPTTKAAVLASVVAHRPDVATWLADDLLRHLFNKDTPLPDTLSVLASLLMLPEGWDKLLSGEVPRVWLTSYAKAVLQEPNNAESMSALMWRKADAARQAAAAMRAAAAAGAAGAGAASSSGGGVLTAEQLQALRGSTAAGAAGAAAAGPSPVPAPSPNILQKLLQQELRQQGQPPQPQPQPQQQQGASSAASSSSRPGSAARAAADSTAGPQQSEIVNMAIAQLSKDRVDVVRYLHSSLNTRLRTAVAPSVALQVLGALNDLPRGWDKGRKQPEKHLAAVAAQAEAHALEYILNSSSGGNAAGGSDWVTAGAGAGAGAAAGSSSAAAAAAAAAAAGSPVGGASSSSGAAGSGGGSSVAAGALWRQLETQHPEVWSKLQDRHKALIRPLTQEKQKKVLQQLIAHGKHAMRLSIAEPSALLYSFIQNHIRLLNYSLPPKVQEGLRSLADEYPVVMANLDEGLFGRLAGLQPAKAAVAVKALQGGDYGTNWERNANNPAAWLNGIVSRALREGAGF